MREDILDELRNEYENRRYEDEMLHSRKVAEIMERIPEIGRLTERRQQLIRNALRGILDGNAKAENIPAEMEKLNQQIGDILEKNGMARNSLEPVYRCPVCEDKGYTGEPVRTMCSCMKIRYQEKLRKAIGLENDHGETFDTFDESILSEENLPGKDYSQRALTVMVRDRCKQWAATYPDNEIRNILLMGQTGLGKSFLMHAMAEKLIERGQDVLMISAYRFLEIARAGYFNNSMDEMKELVDADVLLLDDLGSEPLMQNITVEQLFVLVNERQRRGKATVISTNLNKAEFRERYTERITSRLMDARQSVVLTLMGADVRMRK